ncbi:hypothetical protein VTL71DRAFT_8223 [Oculimacula yallundae]|uniref:Uncharacterized protein n=1 Tax=Oculimacula yallundae TaxID=86028 RepID=A0ABR4CX25_9HELO
MSDRREVNLSWSTIEDYQQNRARAYQIIKEDAGVEHWIQTRSLPPSERPPPLSEDAIEKLKGISGLEMVNRE